VFIDWVANDVVRSIVAPYSLRALALPVVSTPLSWQDVSSAAEGAPGARMWFLPDAVVDRVNRHGDLFRDALAAGARLPAAGDVGARDGS
jgi:bifunctional non-homologous end joining protein LigD